MSTDFTGCGKVMLVVLLKLTKTGVGLSDFTWTSQEVCANNGLVSIICSTQKMVDVTVFMIH
jgi:hypothetical protein